MLFSSLRSLLRPLTKYTLQGKHSRSRRRGSHPCLEALECRTMPATTWLAAGPGPSEGGGVTGMTSQNNPVSGAVSRLAVDPTNANTLYVGSVNGGVWRTTNATASKPNWTPLTDTQASLSIGALEMDPTDATHQTLVAGIGLLSSAANDGGARTGLLRSTNGGTNWTAINGGMAGRNVVGLAARGSTIVAAVDTADTNTTANVGIFKSTNGGTSFTQISTGGATGLAPGKSFDLAADPTNNNILYTNIAAAGGGIYRSTDAGSTWNKVSNATMDGQETNADNTKITVGNNNNVFVGITQNGAVTGLFFSPNGGTSWTTMVLPTTNEGTALGLHPGNQGNLHFSLVADPTVSTVVYAGGDRQPAANSDMGSTFPNSIGAQDYTGRLFRGDASKAPASQWTPITDNFANSTAPHADSRDLAFDANGNLIESDDGGVYRLSTPGTTARTWTAVVGNLQVFEIHSIAYDSNTNSLFAGAQDNGTASQNPGSTTWKESFSGDGGVVAIDNVTSPGNSIRYNATPNLEGFQRSTFDASNTDTGDVPLGLMVGGQMLTNMVDPSVQFYQPYTLDAVAPTRMLINTNHLYESTDQGDTLTDLTGDTGTLYTGVAYGGVKGGVANPNVLYVGQSSNLFLRTAGTGAPTQLAAYPGTGNVLSIALDPTDWGNVFVLDDTNTVYHSSNSGANWQDITGNLTTPGMRTITFAKIGGVGDIVVAGVGGIFHTPTNALGTWSRDGTGLPNAVVDDLQYNATDDVLVAGTLGRGAWTISNYSVASGPLTINGDADNANENDVIRIAINATDSTKLDVFRNSGTPTQTVALSSISNIVVNGLGGNDNLIIDNGHGDPLASITGGLAYDGGTGNNSLTGPNATNTWNLTGTNAGTLGKVSFTATKNFKGGTGVDSFLFKPGGSLSGNINGGGGSSDVLDYSALTAGVSVNLATGAVAGVSGPVGSVQNVTGTSFNDTLTGNSLNNKLNGGAGNDTYVFDTDSALGNDTISESTGTDTLTFASTTTKSVAVNLGVATPQVVNSNLTLTLGSASTIENVVGGTLDDKLTGNIRNNILNGQAGNDTYYFDTDTALGSDTIAESGVGIDTLAFGGTTTKSVTVNLGVAIAQVVNSNLTLTLGSASTMENVLGGSLNDTLTGNSLNNVLTGNGGNDTLSGGIGRDILFGGAGADNLSGGNDDDVMLGALYTQANNVNVLIALMSEWGRTDLAYQNRINHLTGANTTGANNGSFLLTTTGSPTVTDDGAADSESGNAGQDWFLSHTGDVTDASGETTTTIP